MPSYYLGWQGFGLRRRLSQNKHRLQCRLSHDGKAKSLAYNRVEKKYEIAQQLDGTYLLKTDRADISADEAWRIYALLSRAEDAFRDMKSPLSERPIFHQLEHRVEGHILVCSSYCSMFRRVADGPRHDARRLGIGTAVAFDDIDALRNAIVPTVSLSA